MNELALFAGAGGGLLGSNLLGWTTRCAVEIDPYRRSVLLARQRDGMLPEFPVWDDVQTFDGRPWRGHIDVITGGFPCQDISAAGKGAGLTGSRSGLWFAMLRVISEVQPMFVFAENSPNLRTNGLGTVLEGLTSLGYDVRWCVLGAGHVGAPHQRTRMWVAGKMANADCIGNTSLAAQGNKRSNRNRPKHSKSVRERLWFESHRRSNISGESNPWEVEPRLDRMANGVANRLDRERATGNGQVPLVAATAWRVLGMH